MNLKDIQELIKLVAKSELSEFKFKDGEVTVHIRGKSYGAGGGAARDAQYAPPAIISMPAAAAAPAPVAAPAAPAAAPAAAKAAPSEGEGKLVEIKSPMIGTFYRSPSPDKDPYVKVGDKIAKGDTVCVVEAMKLFNEIESDFSGKIVKVLVEDAQPIEYDQPLFLVDPS
ncbi:acetyl-CoA carboxylase biotin carboxyl carrier protein [Neolewinella lacunae]|uniref:Biotin carboxyl carrier protein of acetyl-CoA carboxylase n=1 Tax=Neolewinella lacunae TaxID=1517758 RepID=A0A923T8I6_9BACT|nr:acetyl-CoA carboxylase biotin carboxyl carrier protein [Neolewinella lacunae]MBC6995665.1 acetyl-CoA carboxylase biotin carboxyl carrier protein [Neolewinella lacunae]MDN3634268.1 acetyl-CoA carboxylase biotin carboxyl carrier protein [Neolewinella lacunae]